MRYTMEREHSKLWRGIGAHLRNQERLSITKFNVVASSKEQFEALGGVAAAQSAGFPEKSGFVVSLLPDPEQTDRFLFPECGGGGVNGRYLVLRLGETLAKTRSLPSWSSHTFVLINTSSLCSRCAKETSFS